MTEKKVLSVMRRRAEFLAAARSGKKWVTPNLILQIIKTPASDANDSRRASPKLDQPKNLLVRYGLTASGKIGNAVIRNRARRRLRALVQSILILHARPGYDYVLIARVSTATCDYQKLSHDLTLAVKKLGLWNE